MSETIEESGSNVRMFAAALGTGRTRWRFESVPGGVDEPDDINSSSRTEERAKPFSLLFLYPPLRAIAQDG
jgi:hypothetical protein